MSINSKRSPDVEKRTKIIDRILMPCRREVSADQEAGDCSASFPTQASYMTARHVPIFVACAVSKILRAKKREYY